MLSIGKGFSTGYLTKEIAAGREGYYTGAVAAGEPAGRWSGAGAEALGLSGEVDAALLEAIYHHLHDPTDPGGILGEAHRQYRSAEEIYTKLLAAEPGATPERRAELETQAGSSARQAVSFFDATFSAPKSVSLLEVAYEREAQLAREARDWEAVARWEEKARAVEDAVRAGSAAQMAHLQDVAGLARVGHHGGGSGRWIDAQKWVIASFLQHDSRDHDPQLHVHNAVLNRQLASDGVWRALDGTALYRERAAAGALGERVMEAELERTLGVHFEWRPDGTARELAGVDQKLCRQFSSRRGVITERARNLLAKFSDRYGRDASAAERDKIMRQATLGTRAAKSHTAETVGQRLDRWQAEAKAETAQGLSAVLAGVASAAAQRGEVPAWSPKDVTQRAVALAAERKGSWTRSDLLRAVSDSLPGRLGLSADDAQRLLHGLTDQALGLAVRLTHEESTKGLGKDLLRADGSSVYDSGTHHYAAPWQLKAERALADRASARGAEAFTRDEVQRVLERAEAGGRTLGVDQRQAIEKILSGGSAVDVIKAPAGSGKSFVVGVLAGAWTDQTIAPHAPERRVFGLTTSQNAANVLSGEGLSATANIQAWTNAQHRLDVGGRVEPDEQWRLRADDLVVVDEAGMVDTSALAEIAARCDAAGAKLLLTGDPYQLGAVGAGGALADLFGAAPTHELVEVRRFDHDWEGPASLRLRSGDTSVVGEYSAHGRLRDGGTEEHAEHEAVRGWLADHLNGLDTVLVVGTNDAAVRTNAMVRTELIQLGRVHDDTGAGVILGLTGESASGGDLVTARQNDWTIGITNRDQFRVTGVRDDGALEAVRVGGDTATTLPAAYVNAHVSLGYASTVHSVQGRTVDTSHVVVASGSDAASVYVGMSRGRETNTTYAVTRPRPEAHDTGAVQDVRTRTPESVFTDAMTRPVPDIAGRTATAVKEQSDEDAKSVMTQIDRLSLEVSEATSGRTVRVLDRLASDGRLSHEDRVSLAADQRSIELVDRLLRAHELAGRDAEQVLTEAVAERGFGDAMHPGSVLYSRLQSDDLSPTLTGCADLVPAKVDEQRRERFDDLARAADDRRHELGSRASADPPAWAVATLGPVPDDVFEAADWEEKVGWACSSRELTGWADEQAPLGPDPGPTHAEHRAMWRTAHEKLDLPDSRAAEAEMSEAQHRARIEAWEREQRWAPAYVDKAAATVAGQATDDGHDATLWRAHEDLNEDNTELDEAADDARVDSERGWAQHAELTDARDARGRWLVETMVTRDNAERSAEHLKACGIDPAASDDRVTGEEWLVEHDRSTVADEQTRPVRDEDVTNSLGGDDSASTRSTTTDEPVLETAVPDIRDRSERHASEDTDVTDVPDRDAMEVIRERAAEVEPELDSRRRVEDDRDELERQWHYDDRDDSDAEVLVDA